MLTIGFIAATGPPTPRRHTIIRIRGGQGWGCTGSWRVLLFPLPCPANVPVRVVCILPMLALLEAAAPPYPPVASPPDPPPDCACLSAELPVLPAAFGTSSMQTLQRPPRTWVVPKLGCRGRPRFSPSRWTACGSRVSGLAVWLSRVSALSGGRPPKNVRSSPFFSTLCRSQRSSAYHTSSG